MARPSSPTAGSLSETRFHNTRSVRSRNLRDGHRSSCSLSSRGPGGGRGLLTPLTARTMVARRKPAFTVRGLFRACRSRQARDEVLLPRIEPAAGILPHGRGIEKTPLSPLVREGALSISAWSGLPVTDDSRRALGFRGAENRTSQAIVRRHSASMPNVSRCGRRAEQHQRQARTTTILVAWRASWTRSGQRSSRRSQIRPSPTNEPGGTHRPPRPLPESGVVPGRDVRATSTSRCSTTRRAPGLAFQQQRVSFGARPAMCVMFRGR